MVNCVDDIKASSSNSYSCGSSKNCNSNDSSFESLLKNTSLNKTSSSNNTTCYKNQDSTYSDKDNNSSSLSKNSDSLSKNNDISNKNLSNNENLNSKACDNNAVSKDEVNQNSNSSTVKDDLSKVKDDIKELLKNDSSKGSDMDSLLQQIMQLLTNIPGSGNIDIKTLQNDMNKLGISEDTQNTIIKFISDVKDLVKNSSSDELLNTFKLTATEASDSGEHADLISKIVDILKQKVNENQQNSLSNPTYDNAKIDSINSDSVSSDSTNSEVAVPDIKKLTSDDKNSSTKDITAKEKFVTADEKTSTSTTTGKMNAESTNSGFDENLNDQSQDSSSQFSNDAASTDASTENFLKNLVGNSDSDKSDNSFSKVTAFMNQITQNTTEIKPEDVQTVNRATFIEDMIKSVKYMENNNLKELTVKINPKELGEVVISLTMDKGVMKANLTATNREAYNLLNSSLSDMNSKLNNQNMKIQAFSVNIYNEDSTYFAGQGNEQNNQRNGNNGNNSSNGGNESSNINNVNLDGENGSQNYVTGNGLNMLA